MTRNSWIALIIVAVIFGGGGYYLGMNHASSSTPASRFTGTAGGAAFAGRGGAAGFGAGAGGTIGTIISTDNGSITIQLPNSTSTAATTGTKIILVDNSTQIQALESVPASSLKVGQSVTVAGTANSDGSLTATSVMVRPTGAGGRTGGTTTQTSGQ